MKYLILRADYNNQFLVNEFDQEDEVSLPLEIWERFIDWNEQYKKFIPMSMEERKHYNQEINRLDEDALILMSELHRVFGSNIKIKYFSEGRMKYIGA